MSKRRILLSNEFSLLNTGFSVMGYDLLSELHKTEKYELAELAGYASEDDPRVNTLPWKVYPCIPSTSKPVEHNEYWKPENSRGRGQFGSLKLENTVLEFKPDAIISFRDFWHNDFVAYSPYRHLFNFVWSACVDSEPPDEKWLDVYSTCDLMTSYTQWGLNVLKNYGGDLIPVADTDTMPGINLDIFKRTNKIEARRELGLEEDVNIVLTTMRNQPRKLIPNLMCSFMKFIDKLHKDGLSEVADKTYLYIHSSIPDIGWDIPKEILRYNAANKVLFTYVCDACKYFFPGFIRGERCHCPKCGRLASHAANTSNGLSREEMVKIYNIADLYVQYSICEGLGLPIVEAKACGIPTIIVDYSAPYELANMGGNFGRVPCIGFKQEGWVHANETGQFRGIPDDAVLVKLLHKFFKLPLEERKKWSDKALDTAQKYHGHKLSAEKWMKIIDNLPELDPNRWMAPPKLVSVNYQDIPWNMEPISFVRWCCSTMLPPKHNLRTIWQEKKLLKSLALGYDTNNPNVLINRKTIVDRIKGELDRYNHFELHRYNMLVSQPKLVENLDTVRYRVF